MPYSSPFSQNGFHHTNNNTYVHSIDRSRADGKPLYVAFINLINTFPFTD
ncbi:hypothetical protein EV421DRAFT_1718756 [Armillaria borealis]|uniref:Uncharacterized protein n=1 Tax=Armillaria borealis TaxID=47425 RepID=A0AA39MH50_9AGAR|nr:hypothetical protein EV421DRAFT_1718756 [Armillaria borealis]